MTLTEEEVPLVVRALEHYWSYLVATDRADHRYKDLAERLERKPARMDVASEKPTRKRA